MQHVLVHIDLDQGLGPIGAWSFNGKLRHFYPESLDVAIPERCRVLMAQRAGDISVPEWMDFIADTDPTPKDTYRAFVASDETTLPAILAEFRRTWASSSD